MENGRNREKTYLVILSLLLIANLFVDIEIKTINILGNEAGVDDWLIKLTVVLMWGYFLMSFMQNNQNALSALFYDGSAYITKLNRYGRNIVAKRSKSEIKNFTEKSFTIESISDQLVHKQKLISVGIIKKGSNPVRIKTISLTSRDLFIPKIKSFIYYMFHDTNFNHKVFPVIISILASIALIISLIKWPFS